MLNSIKKGIKDEDDIEIIAKYLSNTSLLNMFMKDSLLCFSSQLKYFCAMVIQYQLLKPKEILFRIGDFGDKFYVILKGKIGILKPTEAAVTMTYPEFLKFLAGLSNSDEAYLHNKNIEENKHHINSCFETYLDLERNDRYLKSDILEDVGYYSLVNSAAKSMQILKESQEVSLLKLRQLDRFCLQSIDHVSDKSLFLTSKEVQISHKVSEMKTNNLKKSTLKRVTKTLDKKPLQDTLHSPKNKSLNLMLTPARSLSNSSVSDKNSLVHNTRKDSNKKLSVSKVNKRNSSLLKENLVNRINFNYDPDILSKLDKKINFKIYDYKLFFVLETGQYFGDYALDGDLKRKATIKAMDQEVHLGFIDSSFYNSYIKLEKKKASIAETNSFLGNYFFSSIKRHKFETQYSIFFHKIAFRKGEMIFSENSKITHIYFLKNQNVEISTSKSVNELTLIIDDLTELLKSQIYNEEFKSQLRHFNRYLSRKKRLNQMICGESSKSNPSKKHKVFIVEAFHILNLIEFQLKRKLSWFKVDSQNDSTEIYKISEKSLSEILFNEPSIHSKMLEYITDSAVPILNRISELVCFEFDKMELKNRENDKNITTVGENLKYLSTISKNNAKSQINAVINNGVMLKPNHLVKRSFNIQTFNQSRCELKHLKVNDTEKKAINSPILNSIKRSYLSQFERFMNSNNNKDSCAHLSNNCSDLSLETKNCDQLSMQQNPKLSEQTSKISLLRITKEAELPSCSDEETSNNNITLQNGESDHIFQKKDTNHSTTKHKHTQTKTNKGSSSFNFNSIKISIDKEVYTTKNKKVDLKAHKTNKSALKESMILEKLGKNQVYDLQGTQSRLMTSSEVQDNNFELFASMRKTALSQVVRSIIKTQDVLEKIQNLKSSKSILNGKVKSNVRMESLYI